MNGAIAEPDVKMINALNIIKNRIIGVNHHFFLTLRNPQSSLNIYNLPISKTSLILL
jgi:hypothetical protein